MSLRVHAVVVERVLCAGSRYSHAKISWCDGMVASRVIEESRFCLKFGELRRLKLKFNLNSIQREV